MAARKSVLFLNSVIPVTKTYDDLVRDKLKPGKFVFTVTGAIKVVGILCLLASVALILGSKVCEDATDYRYLLVIILALTIANAIILYSVFCFGLTVKRPSLWVKIDIISNLLLPVATIISIVLSMSYCNTSGTLNKIPGPLGLAGSVVLIISCGALFLLYRYREEEDENVPRAIRKHDPRKSIFA